MAPEGATPVGPFLPEARALFEGCTPVPDRADSRLYRCDGVTVWLTEREDLTPEQALTEAQARITERLGPGATVVEEALPGAGPVEEVPCRLENLDTRCARFMVPSSEGPLLVWAAAVTWEDRALFAACSHRASEPPYPAVCNGAFTLP
ncbi:hypothetical protein QEG98_03480 [Myxococcus sp. MxC21-1]|uniref:hypothetical protein n=1 Tax=Myxococcus sp. MxC21-1 TaxID=3041439 RepID=UPI00292E16F5|nr:hypothetical protein [Myxococcus sp. MxC21-1]WNZ62890.1 hypothetical protein QEG98_03480 [Myxococcus sp. MxC21-1]